MKVGIIASPRQSIDEPFAGGMEAHTAQLATALEKRGHDITIHAACSSDDGRVQPLLADGKPLVLSGTARSDPSAAPGDFMHEHSAYLELMLRIDELSYDVAHNNSLHYLPVAMAGAISTPLLSTLHTPPTPWLESAIAARPDPAASDWVSVSHSNRERWRLNHRCDVIHNGVDTELWPFGAMPVRGLAAWTGRIVPEKGAHLAIAAARKARRRLVLAGPIGDEDYFAREVEPRLGPDAVYAGHLRTRELSGLVSSAEVALVTPCWDEPFGLVAVEALSSGTPVAAFDRGALGEILDEETGVLAEAGSVESLAQAVDAASKLDRNACRARAVEQFSLARMVSRYEEAYERTAA